MKPDVVVDVGNTRIKWGLCHATGIEVMASLPPDDPDAWQQQVDEWNLPSGLLWTVAGVHPSRRDALVHWLQQRGEKVWIIDSSRLLPLQVDLLHPDKVGLDRLLNAVTANQLREPNRAAILVDAGSAVTVDYVDATGTFRGGAIFPGFRLMAQALHAYTALLPLVSEVDGPGPTAVGKNTVEAMQAGIHWSLVGGIRTLVEKALQEKQEPAELFVTGGQGPALAAELVPCRLPICTVPSLTLEGIRLTALQHPFVEAKP